MQHLKVSYAVRRFFKSLGFNLLKLNDIYICRTAALTSRGYFLNIYSTNIHNEYFNHLPPNGHYMGRTAQLTSRCCILYIYSTNIRNEYFKHAA